METDSHYFNPFIKPLLDQPKSTYRYTQLDIVHSSSYWNGLQEIQRNPDLFPSRPALLSDDPKRRQFDPSVLVVGNLARRPPLKSFKHSVEHSKLMLYQLGHHVLSNQYFQNAGLVRMLLWMPEMHKTDILAILPWQRTSFNVGLDMAFRISEAVSVQSIDTVHHLRRNSPEARSRNAHLNSMNEREVERRMQQADLSVPAVRELQTSNNANHLNAPPKVVSPLTSKVESVAELYAKIESASSRIEQMDWWIRGRTPKDRTMIETTEFPQVALDVEKYSYSSALAQQPTRDRITVLSDLTLRLIKIEANLKTFEDQKIDGATLEDLYRNVHDVNQKFSDLMEKAAYQIKIAVRDLVDDHMAYYLSPSVLSFYERSYEALKATAKDFWPEKSLALFDFMPKTRDLTVPDLASSDEATRFCADLLQILFSSPGLTLPQALDRVGVNAAQDLIPMVPAITDARKGGRLNPNNVKVRMVTEEMVEGLVKAFFEWPFRPQSWELPLASDSPEAKQEESEAFPEP